MAKTLADMTAEEREDCVGMWCSIAGAGRLCVLLSTENDVANLGFSCDNEFTILSLRYKNVTPRFDLPRVWTSDGEPVEMVKEYGNGGWDEEYDAPYHWPMRSSVCKEYCAPFDKAPAEYSRWVSKWEPITREPRRVNGMVNPHV